MSNNNLKALLREYEQKRILAITDLEHRKNKLYNENPRLEQIDKELNSLAFRTTKQLLEKNDENLLNTLNEKIKKLKIEKHNILKSIGKDDDFLEPYYDCPICKDTGYVFSNYKTTMCNCLKQKLFDLEFNKSNIYNLKKYNFENFLLTYYSNVVDKNKYKSNFSPRENIENIKKIAMNFINNFDDPNTKNLLFTGNTRFR